MRTSRLPCARSSARAVAAVTLIIKSPIETMNPLTPGAMLRFTKIASMTKIEEITA